MPAYKLIYFNARGRAELSRWIFAAAGQEYEDIRFEREDWPKYKDDTPYGLAPVLEVDGTKISQSKTIARFLANRFDLAGKTDIEKAHADAIVELLHDDLLGKMIPLFKEEDETKKAELRNQFKNEFWPNLLKNLSRQLKGDFFVGESLTWADLAVADALPWVDLLGMDLGLDKYPELQSHTERIQAIPNISGWLKKRPTTVR